MERITDYRTTERTSPLHVERMPLHMQPARFRQEREVQVRTPSRTEIQKDAWRDYLVQSEGVEV